MIEMYPVLWRGLHQGCAKEGFTEAQSLTLVVVYILSQNPQGIRP
jgi:hypothetical protein